ncbi:hypothetical protein Q5530_05040 [Saccharothrix sp. BKS2]|uniref:hypothetical protein n=1 Tax=Saccharothrix sp. BKS2 TaxID=3064400 RepID=UPI0039E738B9
MSISVRNTGTSVPDVYESGHKIKVHDGQLQVYDGDSTVIAIYAQGHWRAAAQDDSTAN